MFTSGHRVSACVGASGSPRGIIRCKRSRRGDHGLQPTRIRAASMKLRVRGVGLVLVLLVSWAPGNNLVAQMAHATEEYPPRTSDAALLGANSLIGGLSSGLMAKLQGRGFRTAFLHGFLGGAVHYCGKRVTAARFTMSGFLGREMAAVGSSIVRNASHGAGVLDSIFLPIGPLRLVVWEGEGRGVDFGLSLLDTGSLLVGLFEPKLDLDLEASLSSGSPVYRGPERYFDQDVNGHTHGGVIRIGDFAPGSTLPHERVHVAQNDFMNYVWADPFEDWLATLLFGRVPWGGVLQLDVTASLARDLAGAVGAKSGFSRPFEIEAEFLGLGSR
jgi:hypothetical protein